MLEYEKFEKYMNEIKDYLKKEDALDNALRELSPDFGGYCSPLTDLTVQILKDAVGDESDWIGYYIWESEWGTKFPYVWDKDGNEIPLETLKDLYDIIKSESEEDNAQEKKTE